MELDFIRPAPFFFQDAAYLTVTPKLRKISLFRGFFVCQFCNNFCEFGTYLTVM